MQAAKVNSVRNLPGQMAGRSSGIVKNSPPADAWRAFEQSERLLLANPVASEVDNYLRSVKSLLERALHDHQAQAGIYWSPKGRFRQMVYVQTVNQELERLVQDLRDSRKSINLIRRLDAIRGLLVDLFL